MKKAILIIVLGLLWCNISLANFEWIKTGKFSTTNSLTWEDKFLQMIKSNISSEKFYLGMSSNNKKISLFDNFLKVLRGPPNKIKYLENDRYIVASACRAHSCPEKGFVWIDTKEKLLIGLILHYFFEKEENLDDGYFLIFSKNYQTFDKLPEQFFISLKEWIKEEKISPEKIRFIGTDDSIKEFPNTLK